MMAKVLKNKNQSRRNGTIKIVTVTVTGRVVQEIREAGLAHCSDSAISSAGLPDMASHNGPLLHQCGSALLS